MIALPSKNVLAPAKALAAALLLTLDAAAQTTGSGSDAADRQTAAAFETAGEAAAAFFVVDVFLDAAAAPEDMRDWYADSVRYYGRGAQERSVVLTDKGYYITRWPQRSVTPDLATLVVSPSPGGVYDISIEADFSVSNDATVVSGRMIIELTLEEGPRGLRITRENGRILRRD